MKLFSLTHFEVSPCKERLRLCQDGLHIELVLAVQGQGSVGVT